MTYPLAPTLQNFRSWIQFVRLRSAAFARVRTRPVVATAERGTRRAYLGRVASRRDGQRAGGVDAPLFAAAVVVEDKLDGSAFRVQLAVAQHAGARTVDFDPQPDQR